MSPTRSLREANDRLDTQVRTLLARIGASRSVGRMLLVVLAAFTVFALLRPEVFLTGLNLQNMALAVPEIGLLAVAMMIAMLTGGIDLSLVSIANLTAITISSTFSLLAAQDPARAEQAGPALVVLGLCVGLVAGAVNGVLIAYLGITPILATLGTMQIFNGLAVVWTGGKTLYGSPASLTAFGQTAIAGVPMLFLVLVVVTLSVGFILTRTPFGLRLELQGANPEAARFSGIRSRRLLMGSYVLTGFLGAVAGVVFLARNPTASADYGASYTLLVIVIAVLGGTNPAGGYATVTGVFLASMVLQIVQSGFTAMRLSTFQYSIAQGVILITVMVIDQVDWRALLTRHRRTAPVPSTHPQENPQ
ncbi:ABC transporter permease [Actinomyces howellii]|uniref:Autoinducer 2 import system permease protein lsrD n=1 Tax=Actinomyces howellii TaxID=52771 RepID=A0A448HGN8_9ACTO|nr:ABC transporter permease [Actinomyces howellii]VEG27855.1 Autoinducer 2 import system permease protein lsrD [Actinomyces howellii]